MRLVEFDEIGVAVVTQLKGLIYVATADSSGSGRGKLSASDLADLISYVRPDAHAGDCCGGNEHAGTPSDRPERFCPADRYIQHGLE